MRAPIAIGDQTDRLSVSLRALAVLIAVAPTLASCGSEDSESKYKLLEVIDLQGTCAEDHVGQRDHYAGQIVRWQSKETGAIFTYGFLSKPLSPEALIDEAKNSTVYHTPYSLSFEQIDVDTSQSKWVLHGVSDRGEGASANGYNSTCEVEVVKRGMEIRDLPGLHVK
jgi:hypothetical protein